MYVLVKKDSLGNLKYFLDVDWMTEKARLTSIEHKAYVFKNIIDAEIIRDHMNEIIRGERFKIKEI